MKFGCLTVIDQKEVNNGYLYLCECVCGNKVWRRKSVLEAGATRSCGCRAKPEDDELINSRVGRLTVLRRLPREGVKKSRWLCKCDCGNYCEHETLVLRRNAVKDCGCSKDRTERESQVQLILTEGKQSASEIADKIGCRTSAAYNTLVGLERKGVAFKSGSNPIMWSDKPSVLTWKGITI